MQNISHVLSQLTIKIYEFTFPVSTALETLTERLNNVFKVTQCKAELKLKSRSPRFRIIYFRLFFDFERLKIEKNPTFI